MQSYPFTSQVTYDEQGLPLYDRAVDSEFLRSVNKQYYSDGVFYDQSDRLQVMADTGMQVKVSPGCVHIQGAIGIEPNQRTLVVQASDEQDRIDTVVARLDLTLGVRSVDLYIVKGTPSESPQPPVLTRDSTIWELGLANLFVAKNVSTISQQRITDTRLDPSRCGQVGATVQPPFDTGAFFSQLEASIRTHQQDAEAQIEQLRKAIEAVEGDAAWMMKDLYDPAGLGKDVTIQTYTHTKSGTVHEFTGTGANGRAKMTADVSAGDSFTVNGVPVTACMGAESAADAMAGGAWSGKWVTFVFDGSALNFKGGGGGAALKIASAASKDQLPTPAKGIGVITTTAAGNAVVSFDEPAAPSAGDVWIRQGRFSPEVQVSKNPVVNIAPAEVLQWDGAAWASRDGYRAEGGAWVPLQAYLYRDGTVIAENAGSFIAGYNYRATISFREDSVYLTAAAGGDNGVGYDLTTAVFSKKNTLHGLWRAITIPNNGDGRLCAFTTNSINPDNLLNKTVGLRTHKPGDVFEASVDLTGISGEYRLGFGLSSNFSSSKVEIELLRLWVD